MEDVVPGRSTGMFDRNGEELFDGDAVTTFHSAVKVGVAGMIRRAMVRGSGPYWVVYQKTAEGCAWTLVNSHISMLDLEKRHDLPFQPEPSDNYVAWLRWDGDAEHRHLVVCNSDAPGAFKVYRKP
jgi:hypothetical protein